MKLILTMIWTLASLFLLRLDNSAAQFVGGAMVGAANFAFYIFVTEFQRATERKP